MIDVIKTITTRELKVGDRTGGGEVTDIVKKQVWAFVTVTGREKPVRCELDAEWTVTRSEKTEEEKAAEREEMRTAMLWHARVRSAENLQAQRAQIAKAMTEGHDIDYSMTEQLIEAQAIERLWAGVDQVMDANGIGVIEAVKIVVESTKERLTFFRAASQSTNVMSTAIGAVEHDAQVAFCRNPWN